MGERGGGARVTLVRRSRGAEAGAGAHFTCFSSTKVQILTTEEQRGEEQGGISQMATAYITVSSLLYKLVKRSVK
jgi:hypothetical protein